MAQLTIEQALQMALQKQRAGQLSRAEELYRQILDRLPDHAEAGNNLGNVLRSQGRRDEAIAVYRRAIEFSPGFAQAHNNLGVSLQEKGQLEDAVAAYRRAITLKPSYAEAISNLGVALRELGKLDEATAAFGKAIAIRPESAEAHNNLGMALNDEGEFDKAIACHRKAISLNPDFAQAHASLGNALIQRGQIDEAVASYRRAIALKPAFASAHYNLGKAFIEAGKADEGHGEFALACKLQPDNPSFDSALISTWHYRQAYDAGFIAEEHFRWNRRHAEPLRRFMLPHGNGRDPDRRLRIGYVSPDFRSHPVGRFMLPVLEHHDHQRFEIFCYSDATIPDAITTRIRLLATRAQSCSCDACVAVDRRSTEAATQASQLQHQVRQSAATGPADHWREIARLKHAQVAEQIRADGIDILVDLCGHTSGSRLLVFARKPAPVQATWLGYPGTTGLTAMDYRLTDAIADPPGMTEHLHSETLFRLPRTNWCFAETEPSAPVVSPPVLRQGYVTFGSFNNFAKVTGAMLRVWARILREIPGSRLLLKAGAFASADTRDSVLRYFASQGMHGDRLILLGPVPDHVSHLATYARIDIALDTYPYHGTTTTCDALGMGVPVITLAGQSHVSRVGVSLLTAIGLPELVAATADEYVRLAVGLAADRDRLAAMRFGMRQRMRQSALMDAPRFARDIEAAYRVMWRRWCNDGRNS